MRVHGPPILLTISLAVCVGPTSRCSAPPGVAIHLRWFCADSLLLDFAIECLAWHEVRNIVVVLVGLILAFLLLHGLVTLCQLTQRCERVRAQLIEDAGDQFRKFLVFAVAVDGERVGGNRSVYCLNSSKSVICVSYNSMA